MKMTGSVYNGDLYMHCSLFFLTKTKKQDKTRAYESYIMKRLTGKISNNSKVLKA